MREYAAELVRLAPEVILAQSTPNVAALKEATTSIPIVFAVVNDPVAQGFIASMAHPGGNITGFSFLEYSMVGKSLEMLKQIAPSDRSRRRHVQPGHLPLLQNPSAIVRDGRKALVARVSASAGA